MIKFDTSVLFRIVDGEKMDRSLIVPEQSFEEQKTHLDLPGATKSTRKWFISLRWRLLIPLVSLVLMIVTTGAYGIGRSLAQNQDKVKTEDLLVNAQEVTNQTSDYGNTQQDILYWMMSTERVRESIAAGNSENLHTLLEPIAALNEVDLVLVADGKSEEILGLQRTTNENSTADYAITQHTDLLSVRAITMSIEGQKTTSSLVRTNQGVMLLTARPVFTPSGQLMGLVAIGQQLSDVLNTVVAGDAVDVAVFDAEGKLVRTTLPDDEKVLKMLSIDKLTVRQAVSTPGQVPVESLALDGTRYQVAYVPMMVNGEVLGVIGVYQTSGGVFSTDVARHLAGLMAASLAAVMVIVGFLFSNRLINRIERVRTTVDALTLGQRRLRSNLKATDEVGRLAQSVDAYAQLMEMQTDGLVASLRQQRQANARLTAVIESLPDGLVVLDVDGQVMMMNTMARKMIGSEDTLRTASLRQLTAAMTDTLGPALAPGLHALGSPIQFAHEARILQAQGAALVSVDGQRMGTVVIFRDITQQIRDEQEREHLLERMAQDVHLPLNHLAQDSAMKAVDLQGTSTSESLLVFARDMARNARTLQRLINEIREVSTLSPRTVEHSQTPISLSEFVWNVAAQWQPVAKSTSIALEIEVPRSAHYVLGDEGRLTWAIGNLVDNAIKYSPPRSQIRLVVEVNEERDIATIQVVDNGYGIDLDEIEHVFERFYRGHPRTAEGVTVMKPGTGQGLYLARNVIQAHGGRIELKSAAGVGTAVAVHLPLTSEVTLELSRRTPSTSSQKVSISARHKNDRRA